MRIRQQLPSRWVEREALREKGQFWTPDWVAEPMVAYVLQGTGHVFDPAVGSGSFLLAARAVAETMGVRVRLSGVELDPKALEEAQRNGVPGNDLERVQVGDFLAMPFHRRLRGIVANPPYVRHHRIPLDQKTRLSQMASGILGRRLDGRAGLHIYFLLRALSLLGNDGRLSFIVPADTCEGVFAPVLWDWITANFRLDAVVTFAPEASPFQGIDTNPLVLMIRKAKPRRTIRWARCLHEGTWDLLAWVRSGFSQMGPGLSVFERDLDEATATGLTRAPAAGTGDTWTLGHFANTMRGIATGANHFFHLTDRQIRELRIPREFLVPAIARTRDVKGGIFTTQDLEDLAQSGRPTWLFVPDSRPISQFPRAIQRYLKEGEKSGLPERSLIAQRRPWYKMEIREVPPILFAYLGRRNARFILNQTDIRPLTGFLCVYPFNSQPDAVRALWRVLAHPKTVENLRLVGKSYGSGAIKVEPRALERLPLPKDVLELEGLIPTCTPGQQHLFGAH